MHTSEISLFPERLIYSAVALAVRRLAPRISSAPVEFAGTQETEEDTLCARYIKAILEGEKIDFKKEIEIVKQTSGAKFFDPLQSEVFPEKDFHMCTVVDKFDFVLKLVKDVELPYMTKIKM